MTDIVKIGVVQMAMSSDIEANRQKAAIMIEQAAQKGAEVVCLPELFATPYFANQESCDTDYLESIPGPSSQMLAEAARKNKVVLVGGSFYERATEGTFNTTLIFNPEGEQIGMYRKIHIPQDEGFFEKNYFTPGNLGYQVATTQYGKIAPLICFDQWYPEAARAVTLLGAHVIFYPTAIGTVEGIPETEGSWQESWENVQRGHAIANATVVVAVNRVGIEGRSHFWGGSFICNGFGKTLYRASNVEEVFVHEIDLDHSRMVKTSWGFMANRRPDSYVLLSEIKRERS